MKQEKFSLLSEPAIERYLQKGKIIIDPFNKKNLGSCSYDVSLGSYYFREQYPRSGLRIYNPYSQLEVQRVWGKHHQAEPLENWIKDNQIPRSFLDSITNNNLVIWIAPGETILCHTEEFIGGTGGIICTMMKARSSIGRNFIEICKCAGWGDVGYINRWTMEITNNSRFYQIPLVVGRRIAQIVFFEVEKVKSEYIKEGKYQTMTNLEEVKESWQPEMMLPKLYLDREIGSP